MNATTLAAVTEATFTADVLRSPTPVLVDFWAQWCGPCHMMAPVLREIAEERAGQFRLVAVNADENPGIGRDHHVLALPTLMLFAGGQAVWSVVGARPKRKLLSELDDALAAIPGTQPV